MQSINHIKKMKTITMQASLAGGYFNIYIHIWFNSLIIVSNKIGGVNIIRDYSSFNIDYIMEKIFVMLITILLNIRYISLELSENISTNGSMITAPNAGVVLLYKGQYVPSDQVIHNTAMFPMTTTTCYLIPIGAAKRIPACGNYTIRTRYRRFLTDIISIGASSVAIATATTSIILTKISRRK